MTELMCGMSALNGYPGEAPRRGTIPFTDHETVYHIAFVILAALERRDRTGEGAWIDVSQYEVGINMQGEALVARGMGAAVPERLGNADPPHPLPGCYRCRGNDAWITLSVADRAAWRGLAEVIGRPGLAADRDPWDHPLSDDERAVIDRAIAAWAADRTPEECFEALQGRGIAAGVVNDVRDLLLDPHLAERGFFWLVDHHPEQGAGRRAWPGASARLTATPARLRRHAPLLGEHNRPVLRDLIGYGDPAIDALLADGGAGTTPLAAGVRPPARPTAARLDVSPWGYGRIKEYDAAFEERLRQRFGRKFGRCAPATLDGAEDGDGPGVARPPLSPGMARS
jgi:benzylsuccinate CoA-transferase BbsF subunit